MKTKFLVWVMMLCTLPLCAQSLTGDGTSTAPFLITSVDQLETIRNQVNNGNATYAKAYYKLMERLDLSAAGNWAPIGNDSNPFKGTFDGNGKVIQGVKIVDSLDDPIQTTHIGLFG